MSHIGKIFSFIPQRVVQGCGQNEFTVRRKFYKRSAEEGIETRSNCSKIFKIYIHWWVWIFYKCLETMPSCCIPNTAKLANYCSIFLWSKKKKDICNVASFLTTNRHNYWTLSMCHLYWSELQKLGQNELVKSSDICRFSHPIAAQFHRKIHSQLNWTEDYSWRKKHS